MIWESFTNILTQLITLMTMELGVSSAIVFYNTFKPSGY